MTSNLLLCDNYATMSEVTGLTPDEVRANAEAQADAAEMLDRPQRRRAWRKNLMKGLLIGGAGLVGVMFAPAILAGLSSAVGGVLTVAGVEAAKVTAIAGATGAIAGMEGLLAASAGALTVGGLGAAAGLGIARP